MSFVNKPLTYVVTIKDKINNTRTLYEISKYFS